jgi:hypothetical protein
MVTTCQTRASVAASTAGVTVGTRTIRVNAGISLVGKATVVRTRGVRASVVTAVGDTRSLAVGVARSSRMTGINSGIEDVGRACVVRASRV